MFVLKDVILRTTLKIILILYLLIIGIDTAESQISVNDVILHFKAGSRPVQNVVVSNASEETLYVTVNAELVEKPGVEDSPLKTTENLLVSPKKFSIDGKGERTVRLVLRQQPAESEQLYRVVFVPQDRGFGDDVDKNATAPKAVLRVLTGMGILVFVDPVKPEVKLSWTRSAGRIVFRNDGNLHVRLMQGKACLKENVDCIEIPAKRIYGGTTFEIKVEDTKTLFFTKREGSSGDFQNLVIPPN